MTASSEMRYAPRRGCRLFGMRGGAKGTFATMDREFAKDLANAYARLCDRQEARL